MDFMEPIDYKALLNRLIDNIDAATNHTQRMVVLDEILKQYQPNQYEADGILRGLTEAHNRVRRVVQEIAMQLPVDRAIPPHHAKK